MASLWVWFKQKGYGCDYTIGCGEVIEKLQATSRSEVEPEIRKLIADRGGDRTDQYADRTFSEVLLFELVEDMAPLLHTMQQEDQDRRAAEDRKRKLAELEKLKKDLGV